MLQKAFFKVDVVDRIYDTLVFEKTTPGNYSFIVPEEYNYVIVEYAGAGGQQAVIFPNSGIARWLGEIGKGAVKKEKIPVKNTIFRGVIGQQPSKEREKSYLGGTGYKNGENGFEPGGTRGLFGGGGGGSTSVDIDGVLYTAGGGGGAGMYVLGYNTSLFGGGGGGPNGGAKQPAPKASNDTIYNGNNATDTNQIGLNSGNGYVKIWAGYDPYLKG